MLNQLHASFYCSTYVAQNGTTFFQVTRYVSIREHLLQLKRNYGGRKHFIYLNAIKFIGCVHSKMLQTFCCNIQIKTKGKLCKRSVQQTEEK